MEISGFCFLTASAIHNCCSRHGIAWRHKGRRSRNKKEAQRPRDRVQSGGAKDAAKKVKLAGKCPKNIPQGLLVPA
jgi:hypothetical protein